MSRKSFGTGSVGCLSQQPQNGLQCNTGVAGLPPSLGLFVMLCGFGVFKVLVWIQTNVAKTNTLIGHILMGAFAHKDSAAVTAACFAAAD